MTPTEWADVVRQAAASENSERAALAQRANLDARYESLGSEMEFKRDVAQEGLEGWSNYESVCLRHPCKGVPIDHAVLPAHLLRTFSVEAMRKAFYRGDQGALAIHEDLVSSPRRGAWSPALALVSADLSDAWFLFPGQVMKPQEPEPRAVFGNFDPQDPAPRQGTAPQPGLLGDAQRRPDTLGNLADRVVWLTARERPNRVKQMVLVSYAHGGLAPCRFPVPPDGGTNRRFRPVPRGTADLAGRTWPEGVPAEGHLVPGNGVPEVVHRNDRVPLSDVWATGLGEISRVSVATA